MSARMHSVLGWIRRQLGHTGATPVRSRKRPARVTSALESLERREVLTSTAFSPFLAMPVTPVTITAPTAITTPSTVTTSASTTTASSAYYYGQPVIQAPATVQAASVMPVVYSVPTAVPNAGISVVAADPNTGYVQSLYRDVLGRVGGPSEVAGWDTKLDTGVSPQVVAEGFVNSLEHRQDQVNAFYEDFLHRTPPDALSAIWVNDLLAGGSEEDIAAAVLDSPEYQAAHQDPTQFIQGLYQDVLNRPGEPAGVAAWQSALASGESRQAIVASFVTSPEAVDRVVDDFYATFLGRQPEPVSSALWVGMLEAPNGSATDAAIGILTSAEFLQDAGK